MELNRILLGDCLDKMKTIPDNSISGCITDPPYNYEFIGKNWDNNEIKRRLQNVESSNSMVRNIPYGSGLSGGVRNARWYEKNRNNIKEYREWIESWGAELYRILKPGAFALVFNSSRTSAHVQVGLEASGFYARDTIVWRRNSGIPKGLNVEKKLEKIGYENPEIWQGWHSALRSEWEAITVVQKPLINNYINTLQISGVGLFKAENNDTSGFQSNIIENIKRDKKDKFNTHVTVKPLELIIKLIELIIPLENEKHIIIDPFMGSGTTAIAANRLGVDWIGIEISEEYRQIAEKRISNDLLKNNQTKLF
ncbi:MAG: DNA-methyltransferase [Enterococcus italicus]|uniref:DNA-methyltransferase n=1 Tax=Enterococcus italicus TaxID=246144 RepID=UPI003995DCEE